MKRNLHLKLMMAILMLFPVSLWAADDLTDIFSLEGGTMISSVSTNLANLTDNDLSTTYTFPTSTQIVFQSPKAVEVKKYSITSSNDTKTYPTAWKLEVSKDGNEWKTLHSLSFQSFTANQTREFIPSSDGQPYIYFRLTVSSVKSGNSCQLNEWRVYGEEKKIPAVPSDVRARSEEDGTVTIAWRDNSDNEDSFEIERSYDSENYVKLGSVSADVTTFKDSDISAGIGCMYRVRAVGNGGIYSNYALSEPIRTREVELKTSVTYGRTYSVTDKNGTTGAEGVEMVMDGDKFTKYLSRTKDTWVRVNLQEPFVVCQYTITSANDAQERDPKAWSLEASENGTAWFTIDQKTDQYFGGRFQTNVYTIDNDKAYKYYRLSITDNQGANITQLAEWGLYADIDPIAIPVSKPEAPTNLVLNPRTFNHLQLTWEDNSNNETSFRVEQSLNGEDWTALDRVYETPDNTTAWYPYHLQPNTTYYFRVCAVNDEGDSDFSNVVTTTTEGDEWPDTWPDFVFDGNPEGNLTKVYSNDDIGIYLPDDDNILADGGNVEWTYEPFTKMWQTMKQLMGGAEIFSDPRLFIVLHETPDGGGLGRLFHYRDHDQKYRNIVHVTINKDWDWTRAETGGFKYDVLTHEVFHIVEGIGSGRKNSPFYAVWGDSKYAEIFQYAVFSIMNPERAKSWHEEYMTKGSHYADFPNAGSEWYAGFMYPIYAKYGGWEVYRTFFDILGKNYKQKNMELQGNGTIGELIHFMSAAAGESVKGFAKDAFGWTDKMEMSLLQAQRDYPQLTYAEPDEETNILKAGGTLTSEPEANNISYLTDGNTSTVYRVTKSENIDIIYKNDENSAILSKYTVYVDSSLGYQPKSWVLYGSNDGENWVAIDEQTSPVYTENGITVDLPGTVSYSQFKLSIKSKIMNSVGIAELELWGKFYPINPTDLKVRMKDEKTAYIDWSAPFNSVDHFELERSTDGVSFTKIADIDPINLSYLDENLASGDYYYRLRSVNAENVSDYTNVAHVNTEELGIEDITVKSASELLYDLSKYPDNRVKLYNPAGILVYDRHHTGNEWNAISTGSVLQTGIYIVVLDLGNGTAPVRETVIIK